MGFDQKVDQTPSIPAHLNSLYHQPNPPPSANLPCLWPHPFTEPNPASRVHLFPDPPLQCTRPTTTEIRHRSAQDRDRRRLRTSEEHRLRGKVTSQRSGGTAQILLSLPPIRCEQARVLLRFLHGRSTGARGEMTSSFCAHSVELPRHRPYADSSDQSWVRFVYLISVPRWMPDFEAWQFSIPVYWLYCAR